MSTNKLSLSDAYVTVTEGKKIIMGLLTFFSSQAKSSSGGKAGNIGEEIGNYLVFIVLFV